MKKIIIILTIFTTILFANAIDISLKYEYLGKYKEAITVLLPELKKDQNNYLLNLRIAYLFYLNKSYKNSLIYYKKASLEKKESLEPIFGLIKINLVLENYKKVENLSYRIINEDYYNYYGNIYLIESLIKQKNFLKAKKILDRMLILYPTSLKLNSLKNRLQPSHSKSLM